MRGLGKFQMAQMKGDPRTAQLFRAMREVIDLLEVIVLRPHEKPEDEPEPIPPARPLQETGPARLKSKEAAAYVQIARSRLAKMRSSGGGPRYAKIGASIIYDTRDLDAWLNAHKKGSTSDPGKKR